MPTDPDNYFFGDDCELEPKTTTTTTTTATICQELITNGDFETGTFNGWTKTTAGACQLNVNDGTFVHPLTGQVTPPIAGNYDVVTSQVNPGTCTLSQTITLPAGITSATLSWKDRVRNYASDFSDPNQEMRVLLDADVIWSTNPGDTLQQPGPNSRSYDVTAILQGKSTAVIQFIESDDQGPFSANWDEISLHVCYVVVG